MAKIKILGIAGSLRKDSLNRALLQQAVKLVPETAEIEIWDQLGELPLYNQDLDSNMPTLVKEFKEKIRSMDAVLFVTPEYNRSIPGVLKNAIDWASRPYGDSAWAGKPVAVIGASGGNVGTALAQAHLKQVLLYLDMQVLGQPEFYLSGATGTFDEKTQAHLRKVLDALIAAASKSRG